MIYRIFQATNPDVHRDRLTRIGTNFAGGNRIFFDRNYESQASGFAVLLPQLRAYPSWDSTKILVKFFYQEA
jgi:hypothetical protein